MSEQMTARVQFIDGQQRIVEMTDVQPVGDEGARRATAHLDGLTYRVYNRVEWGFLWHEQDTGPHSPESANYGAFDDDL